VSFAISDALLAVVLVFLTLAVAVNTFVMVRMAAVVRNLVPAPAKLALPTGETLPALQAQRAVTGERISTTEMAGRAGVLVFLSASCKMCNEKLPQLEQLRTPMHAENVALWIIGMDSPRRMKRWLESSPLIEYLLLMRSASRRQLNPTSGSPFYIFIDHRRIVQASGFLGDADWQSFVGQMNIGPHEPRVLIP
jgi:peroxiredoxin